MNAGATYKVQVCIERRDDGGLRVWSDDLPELVLSHADAEAVIADIPRAMEAILSERLGSPVHVEELTALPPFDGRTAPSDDTGRASREFAARAA